MSASLESRIRQLVHARGLDDEFTAELLEATMATFATAAPLEAPAAPTSELELPDDDGFHDRYEILGALGAGGMGEVWRVRDQRLLRTLAMKVIRVERAADPSAIARFVEEVRVTAQLQHPGIVPVYDVGRLPSGPLYFTMQEVTGRTFTELIDDRVAESDDAWSLFQMVDALRRVCDTIAYAHARGVAHRDLKPANLMVGSFGEVLVLDWGVVALVPPRPHDPDPVVLPGAVTRPGIAGTPSWMAPEQADGTPHDRRRADVYALGAVLYTLLSGRAPYRSPTPEATLDAVRTAPPPRLTPSAAAPEALVEIAERAMARDPDARPADAHELADAIASWLDGAQRRHRANAILMEASRAEQEIAYLRRRHLRKAHHATVAVAAIPAWQTVRAKRRAWEDEDSAAEVGEEGARRDVELEQKLYGALIHAPDHPEAHRRLAERHRRAHAAAERARDPAAAARAEAWLRTHTHALPLDDNDRTRHEAWLAGNGRVTVQTEPPGALVAAHHLRLIDRRLAPGVPLPLGARTPVTATLERGSWVLEISARGRHPVTYPVMLDRMEHHTGHDPEGEPAPIALPEAGSIPDDHILIPAGWYRSGGDDALVEKVLPPRRIWVDTYIVQRDPVTNRQWIAFLDDLVRSGREDEALAHAPRYRGTAGEPGAMIYGRSADGFELVPDDDGDIWQLDWPVVHVCHADAEAYAAWRSTHDALPWRLLTEYEWEKAARGVDGRLYPWGDFADPAFACMYKSHRDRPLLAAVDAFPLDLSVWGVRGLGGNVMDWCSSPYLPEGPPITREGRPLPEAADHSGHRVARGGTWCFSPRGCRSDTRWHLEPRDRRPDLGVRLARTL